MIDAPLALAFTAGLVATVNPCGFAMLPAYLSYFLGLDDDVETARAGTVARALLIGAVVSAGFLAVFGVVGAAITLGFRPLIGFIPWAALVIGVGVAVLGVAMLAGFRPTTRLPTPRRGAEGRGFGSVFVFGSSYAVASLSCTLPIFLTVVAGVATRTSLVAGLATFLVYGLGMSLLLLVVTLALGLGKRSLVTRLRRSGPYLDRVAGGILVVAGVYVVWYWAVNLSRGVGARAASSPVAFVESLSARATGLMGEHAELVGLVLASLLVLAVVYAVLRRPRDRAQIEEDTPVSSASVKE